MAIRRAFRLGDADSAGAGYERTSLRVLWFQTTATLII
jgi:hypothetical protein